MDLKSFVFGAICGGLVYAGVSSLFVRQSPAVPAESNAGAAERAAQSPSEQPAAVADEKPDSPLSDSRERVASGRTTTESPSAEVERAPETPRSTESSPASVGASSSASPSSSGQSKSTQQQRSWFAHHRAVLMEERKDEAWAYFMEQAIQQFLAKHPSMPEFSLEYIECRTTACQIGVAGYDESTGPTWQRVMYDMRQQSWYEFGQVGSSSGPVEGRHMTIAELKRRGSDSERR